jgi:hypothetical protein
MILAEPALESLKLLWLILKLKAVGLWVAARTCPLDESVGVVHVDAAGSSEITEESEGVLL